MFFLINVPINVVGSRIMKDFKGFISGIDLLDFIQILNLKKSTCRVRVEKSSKESGLIYIKDGDIVHAETVSGKMGEYALHEILNWNEGVFENLNWEEPIKKTINKDTMFLLLDFAKMKDELNENNLDTDSVKEEVGKDYFLNFLKKGKHHRKIFERALSIALNYEKNILCFGLTNSEKGKTLIFIHRNFKKRLITIAKFLTHTINISRELNGILLSFPISLKLDLILISNGKHTLFSLVEQRGKKTPLLYLFKDLSNSLEKVFEKNNKNQ